MGKDSYFQTSQTFYPGWHLTESIYYYYCLLHHPDNVKCFLVRKSGPTLIYKCLPEVFSEIIPKVINKRERNLSIYLFLTLSLYIWSFSLTLVVGKGRERDREGEKGVFVCECVYLHVHGWCLFQDLDSHTVISVSSSGEGRWAWESHVTSHPKCCYLLASCVALGKLFNLPEPISSIVK